MTSSTAPSIINIVFLPIYVLLLLGALLNIFLVGPRQASASGFLSLSLFGAFRTAGDAILLYAHYGNSTSAGVYTAGLLLQGMGYNFLFSCALAVYTTVAGLVAAPAKSGQDVREDAATASDSGDSLSKPTPTGGPTRTPRAARLAAALTPSSLLQYLNLTALILLIVGYSNSSSSVFASAIGSGSGSGSGSDSSSSSSSDGDGDTSLPATIRAANLLLLIGTVLLLLLIARAFSLARSATATAGAALRPLRLLGLALLPFLLARILYSAITAFSAHPFAGIVSTSTSGTASGTWYRLVFFYMAEAAGAFLLVGTGLALHGARRGAATGGVEGEQAGTRVELAELAMGREETQSALPAYAPVGRDAPTPEARSIK